MILTTKCHQILRLITALALFPLLILPLSVGYGQSNDPRIISDRAYVDYPHSVTFQLALDDGTAISEAKLTYQIGQNSCLTAGTQVPVDVGGSTLEWTWIMSRSGNPPPGARIWWEWTVTDSEGEIFSTPRQELTFSDDRFDWRTQEAVGDSNSASIYLHWYEGDEVGPVLLDAAVAGLNRLEEDIGIELEGDVQIFIYEDSAAMREAVLYIPDWAGGQAFGDYNVILIGVPPYLADSWGSATVRHELAHLVIGQFGQSCLGGSLPTWLSEGLAVYAEGEPDEQTLNDLEEGRTNNNFQPVRSLNGAFPAHGNQATAAYSQSYSLVDFLLEAYGEQKMQELILTLASAEGYDDALENVYGFNADGLEAIWREKIDVPPRLIPPTPTPVLAASVPTAVPLNVAASRPTPVVDPSVPESASEPVDSAPSSSSLCGLAMLPAFFVVGIMRIKLRPGRRPSISLRKKN
jgi:hypothetical protein